MDKGYETIDVCEAAGIWKTSNTDVMEITHFKDLVESLKPNKEIKGLQKYVR